MGWNPNATYQVLWKSVHRFQRRNFFKGFYHIWAWWPSWSCDPDATISSSMPMSLRRLRWAKKSKIQKKWPLKPSYIVPFVFVMFPVFFFQNSQLKSPTEHTWQSHTWPWGYKTFLKLVRWVEMRWDMSLILRKPAIGVSDQVRHTPGCTATEYD